MLVRPDIGQTPAVKSSPPQGFPAMTHRAVGVGGVERPPEGSRCGDRVWGEAVAVRTGIQGDTRAA